jgi:hypothetical protein
MWIQTSTTTLAWVSWRPSQIHLHYNELYRGVWEFLREPPRRDFEARAREYLLKLKRNTALDRDRVEWVKEWIAQLPVEESRRRVMGEETYALLRVVCYDSPGRSGGKLRAG